MFHNQSEAPIDFAVVVGQAERLVLKSLMAQGVVFTAGSTTAHGEAGASIAVTSEEKQILT